MNQQKLVKPTHEISKARPEFKVASGTLPHVIFCYMPDNLKK